MNEYLDAIAFCLGYAVMIGLIIFLIIYLFKDSGDKSVVGKEESFSFPFTVPGDILLGSVVIRVIISEQYTDYRKYIIQSLVIRTVSHISNKITLTDNLIRYISKQQYEDLQFLLHNQIPNAVITAQQFIN